MCGRYEYKLTIPELAKFYEAARTNANKKDIRIATGGIYPTDYVITIANNAEKKATVGITRWGFDSFEKGKVLINARAETVLEKKTFKKPFIESRVVFPMSGFFEWDKEKNKTQLGTNHVLFVGGFYRIHKKEDEFVTESIILTTAANDSVKAIHDRMPLLIPREAIKQWLTDPDFAKRLLKSEMSELIVQ